MWFSNRNQDDKLVIELKNIKNKIDSCFYIEKELKSLTTINVFLLKEIVHILKKMLKILKRFELNELVKSLKPSVVLIGEERMGNVDLIKYVLELPPWPDNDVVHANVTVELFDKSLSKVESNSFKVLKGERQLGPFVGQQDFMVNVHVSYVDDAGNVSPAVSDSFFLTDVFAPPPPASTKIVYLGEEHVVQDEEDVQQMEQQMEQVPAEEALSEEMSVEEEFLEEEVVQEAHEEPFVETEEESRVAEEHVEEHLEEVVPKEEHHEVSLEASVEISTEEEHKEVENVVVSPVPEVEGNVTPDLNQEVAEASSSVMEVDVTMEDHENVNVNVSDEVVASDTDISVSVNEDSLANDEEENM